jgi:hypothetical protein
MWGDCPIGKNFEPAKQAGSRWSDMPGSLCANIERLQDFSPLSTPLDR